MKKIVAIYNLAKYSVVGVIALGILGLLATLLKIHVISFWIIIPMIFAPFFLLVLFVIGSFIYILRKNILASYYFRKAVRIGKKAEQELKDINAKWEL